ncbi:hypothetical protein AB0H28_11165 [Micromonospora sp. NPDC050980]
MTGQMIDERPAGEAAGRRGRRGMGVIVGAVLLSALLVTAGFRW